MAETTTITVRISMDAKAAIDRLAQLTKRSRSYLMAEALAQYLPEELDAVEGIQKGLEDLEAGRVIPHDEVMADLDAVVERARKKQQRKSA